MSVAALSMFVFGSFVFGFFIHCLGALRDRYQDMLDAYASRLYLNRSLQKLSAEFEFLEENQPVTMRAASDPYLGLRTPSVQTGLAADVSMRGIEVFVRRLDVQCSAERESHCSRWFVVL